ncbi:MAG: tRNA lysidine(34) synthetase TilS [Sideroxydans sp.]
MTKSLFADHLTEQTAAHLAALPCRGKHILLGLSGGIDSVVLLHLLATLAPRLEFQLSALHVHHGISPNADEWARFCLDLCAEQGVACKVAHVDIQPLRETLGIEAAARQLRHAALAVQDCDFIALAHHADDQAETLLLQLLRGAGVRGASAMPLLRRQDSRIVIRPLLNFSRAELLAYAQQHGLRWVEDESNCDECYPRNFVRHRVFGLLQQKFPACRETLARSAQHFSEAAELLDELAAQDGAGAIERDRLAVEALSRLSTPRAKNLLRYFLHQCGAPMPQSKQLEQMLHQLCSARRDAAVCVQFGNWQLRRFQGYAEVLSVLPPLDPALCLRWQGEATLPWPPLQGRVLFTQATGEGISMCKLRSASATLRLRSGGEHLRPHPRAARRTLKHLLQEHQVPPWQRERLPLLFCGDELVAVVGVAIAADFQANTDEVGMVVSCK